MRIDLMREKDRVLSTQEMYEIIDFATQSAEDNGFINSFIFQRSLYLFAAIRFYEERKEEISHLVAENVNVAWDNLIKDGTLEDMVEKYPTDLEMLEKNGEVWLDEFTAYAHSARGLLNTIQEFTGDIVKQATEQLQTFNENPGAAQEIINIGQKWGADNKPIDLSEAEKGSLFNPIEK